MSAPETTTSTNCSAIGGADAKVVDEVSVWPWVKAARDLVKAEPRLEPESLPVKLLPWLYLSDMPSVLTTTDNNNNNNNNNNPGYTAVLTTNKLWRDEDVWKVTAQLAEQDIAHGYVGGVDIIGYKMIEYHWDDARAFIEECLQRTETDPKIIVHCAAGTNRSALIAGAAMIAFSPTTDDASKDPSDEATQSQPNELNFLDVIRILKKQRGVVLNNVWFIQQLAEFAQRQGRLGPRPSGYTDEPLRKSELVF